MSHLSAAPRFRRSESYESRMNSASREIDICDLSQIGNRCFSSLEGRAGCFFLRFLEPFFCIALLCDCLIFVANLEIGLDQPYDCRSRRIAAIAWFPS